MDADITDLVSKCRICEKYQSSNRKEPMIPHEIPTTAFEKIGCDFADYGGKSYLIVKDFFSKWIEIHETKSKTAETVIRVWSHLFATMGFPKVIVADNQPFSSRSCQMFAKQYQIEIKNSSPNYPQSNGMSERAVQTAKSILRKASESGKSYMLSLMEYRNTPLPVINLSPADIVFGRKLRTSVPTSEHLIKNQHNELVYDKLKESQSKMKIRYDQHTCEKPDFHVGERVLIQDGKEWQPAVIVNRSVIPRSYIVRYKNKCYQRNSIHLRKQKSAPQSLIFNFDDEENNENVNFNNINNNAASNQPGNNLDCERNIIRTRYGREIRRPDFYGNPQ